jgi:hypothetical protein
MTHPFEVLSDTTLKLSEAELELLNAHILAMEEAAEKTTTEIESNAGNKGNSLYVCGT